MHAKRLIKLSWRNKLNTYPVLKKILFTENINW